MSLVSSLLSQQPPLLLLLQTQLQGNNTMDDKKRMPRLLSLPTAAESLGISLRSLYNLKPAIPRVSVGGRKLIREDELRGWLDSQSEKEVN
ncbi:helix-turn-helix domain-containing protein [bacterium]|nr:helix-turn-helix domain-containing protein [bacterium]